MHPRLIFKSAFPGNPSGVTAIIAVAGLSCALVAGTIAVLQTSAARAQGFPFFSGSKVAKPSDNTSLKRAEKNKFASRGKIVPLADDEQGPDTSALRYYASLGQKKRAEAEVRRLKKLYPDWEVPRDIFDKPVAGAIDEQPLWDLYAADEFVKLREEISKRMREEPGWQPSDDLMSKIRRKEVRNKITKFRNDGNWKELAEFVKKSGFAADQADVDVLWIVAEAHARVKQTDVALQYYMSILHTSKSRVNRLATVQKAMATLRMVDVEKLIALAKTDKNGRSELAPIAIDIIRARISAYLHDERKEKIPEDQLKLFEEFARKAEDPNQPGLVAWYYYKTKVFDDALEWFKIAIKSGGDAMIAHGLAHTLRELKRWRDTEEVSYAWRQPLVNNIILFTDILERDLTKELPPYIHPRRLLRYAQVSMDVAAGEGAQGLAWYAYNTCQYEVARKWFRHAVAWHPKEATVYGLALVSRKLKDEDGFWRLLNRYDGLFPKVISLIYPDDYYYPPSPCDIFQRKKFKRGHVLTQADVEELAPELEKYNSVTRSQASNFNALRPTLQTPGLYPGAARGPVSTPQVGNTSGLRTGTGTALAPAWKSMAPQFYRRRLRDKIEEPNISKALFPVSVDGQNPLRFSPVGRLMGSPAPASTRIFRGGQILNEPVHKMKQLVARRVPGVGPMPYERWGYTLLPAYNGRQTASAPHNAVKAPKGTLWTTLQAKDAQSTLGSRFNASSTGANGLIATLQAILRAPRVPSPAESRSGPWSSPKPYKSEKQLEAEKGLLETLEGQPSAANTDASKKKIVAGAVALTPVASSQNMRGTIRPAGTAAVPPAKKTKKPSRMEPGTKPARAIRTGAKDALGRAATDHYNAGRYEEALKSLDQRAGNLKESTQLQLLRGWSLIRLKRVGEAKKVFAAIGKKKRTIHAGSR